MSLYILPLDLREANEYVRRHHRHHGPARGCKFAIGVGMEGSAEVRGVAIVGRPVARHLQDGWTLEVTRLATDGVKGGCQALYAAAWRAARAMGYRRVITYIVRSESGVSLKAAGWRMVGEVPKRSWHRDLRPRIDKSEPQERLRWEVGDSVSS